MTGTGFRATLVAIAALALILRLFGTEWGRPFAYHFDEPFVLKPALRMVATGDPNPHFFRYPSLLIYLESVIVAANNTFRDMPLREPQEPAYGPQDLYPETWPALLGGRHLVAVIGALGVVAAGLVARTIGGHTAGIFAALTLALFPLHVEHSHYLTTDVPAATFATLAIAALLPSLTWRRVFVSGVAVGLAASTKYTAAALLPLLLLFPLTDATRSWRSRLGLALLLCLASAAAFLVTTPFALLDMSSFVADLRLVQTHYSSGHLGAEGTANWAWYLMRLSQDGLGTVGLGVIGAGSVFVLVDAGLIFWPKHAAQRPHRHRPLIAILLLVAAVAWFVWLGSVRVRFERNLLPSVVFGCIAAGCGWAAAVDATRARNRRLGAGVVAIFLAAMIGPLRVSAAVVAKLGSEDTRTVAARWAASQLAPGTSIVREEYTPQLDARQFRVRYVWSLAVNDDAEYARQDIDYLIASQAIYGRILNERQPQLQAMADRYRRMFLLPRVATFAPGPGVSGPVIEVLEVRHGARGEEPR